MIRHELLMTYKFLAQYNACMCSKHVGMTTRAQKHWSYIGFMSIIQ